MKSAKEWAGSIVGEVERRPLGKWGAYIVDVDDSVALQGQVFDQTADVAVDAARRIIARLVERVQADARASLEEEIAKLKEERDAARGNVVLSVRVMKEFRSMLSKAVRMEPIVAMRTVREVLAMLDKGWPS